MTLFFKYLLFYFRDSLEWVKCLVSLVQRLLSSDAWKAQLHTQLSDCIQQLTQVSAFPTDRLSEFIKLRHVLVVC